MKETVSVRIGTGLFSLTDVNLSSAGVPYLFLLKLGKLYKLGATNDLTSKLANYKITLPGVEGAWILKVPNEKIAEEKMKIALKIYNKHSDWYEIPDEILKDLEQRFIKLGPPSK